MVSPVEVRSSSLYPAARADRKSTRLNSSHVIISYAVFCLKKITRPYIVPNPVVSALFGALLTKVGIYSILRVFSLIFAYQMDITPESLLRIVGVSLLFCGVGALSRNYI